jgi:23S rRNA (cytidine2498-2'-O)-methyltransferase
MTPNILLYCRPGFEAECAAEFLAGSRPCGQCECAWSVHGSGYVIMRFSQTEEAARCAQAIDFSSLCFSRQIIVASDPVGPMEKGDRVAPVIDMIKKACITGEFFLLETADTNDAKQLSGLCKKLFPLFLNRLVGEGILPSKKPGEPVAVEIKNRIHVFFASTDTAYFGYSSAGNSCPWQMGIPRLKFPSGAPSRSTLKLEEAFYTFLPEGDMARRIKPGMTAVDLGAAPGGWTWQLVSRGVRVTAVDNGNMDSQLLASGLVHHVRGDGFTFAPKRPVDWMVCDIVDQPSRIARLAAQWLERMWCDNALFNLKLPMKKRYEEVRRCREIIASELGRARIMHSLRIKHLYHDREEVTAMLAKV